MKIKIYLCSIYSVLFSYSVQYFSTQSTKYSSFACHRLVEYYKGDVLFVFRAFSGKYVRMKDEGVYTCIICDNPLFRSEQKYDTMCGWPAFQDVIAQGKVTLKKDGSHGR